MKHLEFAVDTKIKERTNKVHYSDAHHEIDYLCPYCYESVILKSNCFSHRPIHNRTPIQRACPEYHPATGIYDKISNPIDRLYVYNGGIPLYLCGDNTFELRAYIPPISNSTLDKLNKEGVKLYINTNAPQKSEVKIHHMDNLSYYKVDILQRWIDIECIPDVFSTEEVRMKWLWGIRGIDENDIYHSNKNGGYRLAINGYITVGSNYRIIHHPKSSPSVNGINFKKIGNINFKKFNGTTYLPIVYDVYEMQVLVTTKESLLFVENRGYKLVEKKDELIPLWPPAVIEGNQLFYDKSSALFLHIKRDDKENVYIDERSHVTRANSKLMGIANIITIPLKDNGTIWCSQSDDSLSEIKYHIQCSEKALKHQCVEKEIIITDSNSNPVSINQGDKGPPIDGKLYIKSNLPFTATVRNGNFVMFSSSMSLEKVDYLWNLIVDFKAFGKTAYQYNRENKINTFLMKIDWDNEYKKLSLHKAPVAKASYKYIELLYMLNKVIEAQSFPVYRLLESWIKINCVPISAFNDLDELAYILRG